MPLLFLGNYFFAFLAQAKLDLKLTLSSLPAFLLLP